MSVLKSRRTESDVAFLDVARQLEAYTSEDGAPPDKVNENVWTPGAYGWNKQQEE